MKKAMILAVGMATALLGQTRQAHAIVVEWSTLQQAAKIGYEAYKKFFSHELTLEDAMNQILAAIDRSRDEIMDHMDHLAATEELGCASASVVDFENLEILDPSNAELVAIQMKNCLFSIRPTMEQVTPSVADELGFAFHMLAPMVLDAYAFTDQSSTRIVDEILLGEETLDEKLAPHCFENMICENPPGEECECHIRCAAYTNDPEDTGFGSAGCAHIPPDFRTRTIARALRRTSAAIESGVSR